MKSFKEYILENKKDTNYISTFYVETNDNALKDFFWKECGISQEYDYSDETDKIYVYRMYSREKYLKNIEKISKYLTDNNHSFSMYITCDDNTHKKLISVINKFPIHTTDDAEQYDFRNHIHYESLDFKKYSKEVMNEIIACLN